MIELLRIDAIHDSEIMLHFSDGSSGKWSAAHLIERDTVLTRRLREPAFFARAFIEAGALAWPNGLELSAGSLFRQLDEAGGLTKAAA